MLQTAISSLAHVHPKAKLGQNVTIEPFAVVHEDVEIGDHTWVGSHAVVHNGARIGRHCRIFHGAIIASIPQDLKFQGEYSTVEVGDHATVREFATLNRGTSYSHRTVIGPHALVMAYVHVAHDCRIGQRAILTNGVNIAGHVEVGEWAIIGGLSAVHQFCRIGKHAMISGGSMVRKDVPPFTLAGREPISYVGINYRGLMRRNFSPETIRELQEIYRVLFLSKRNTTQALEHIEEHFPVSMERDEVLEFIRSSERGIMRGYQFN